MMIFRSSWVPSSSKAWWREWISRRKPKKAELLMRRTLAVIAGSNLTMSTNSWMLTSVWLRSSKARWATRGKGGRVFKDFKTWGTRLMVYRRLQFYGVLAHDLDPDFARGDFQEQCPGLGAAHVFFIDQHIVSQKDFAQRGVIAPADLKKLLVAQHLAASPHLYPEAGFLGPQAVALPEELGQAGVGNH